MTDKEHIIIDIDRCKYRDKYTNFCLAEKNDIGETYTICTGTDCYFKQLKRKEQECERLKRKVELMMDCPDCKVDEYKKALEKIEEYTREQFCENCDDYNTTEYNQHCEYCEYYEYFDIINKAKEN